jgi:hypothetical protein
MVACDYFITIYIEGKIEEQEFLKQHFYGEVNGSSIRSINNKVIEKRGEWDLIKQTFITQFQGETLEEVDQHAHEYAHEYFPPVRPNIEHSAQRID